MTPEERAELQLLNLANEKGKFALEYGMPDGAALQAAFERGIDEEWFRLVDLCPAAAMPATAHLYAGGQRIMRVFRLTGPGWWRRGVLREMAKGESPDGA